MSSYTEISGKPGIQFHSTEQGSNTMANGTDGFALREEVLQYSSQGPTVGKVSHGTRTAGNQEVMVMVTVCGFTLSRLGICLEAEALYPTHTVLSYLHRAHGLSPWDDHL